MCKYDAIVLDFDGVIIDSADIKNQCFKKLYEKYGVEDKVDVTKGGKSRYEKIKYFHKKLLDIELTEEEVNRLAQEYSKLLEEPLEKCPWVKGAKEFILKYYGKKDLYIVSGTPYKELKKILEKRKILKYFEKIYDSSTPKSERLKMISKRYNNIVFIGDQLTDYKAAEESDIDFIGINQIKDNFPIEIKVFKTFDRVKL